MGKIFKPQVKFGFLETYSGETIETKVERVTANNEPITDGAEIVYTEKKNGVMPEYNIRTYRDWETDRKSTRLNSSHSGESRMPSSA